MCLIIANLFDRTLGVFPTGINLDDDEEKKEISMLDRIRRREIIAILYCDPLAGKRIP